VDLEGPRLAHAPGEAFYGHLFLRDRRVAGVTELPDSWAAPESFSSVTGQQSVLELLQDETTDRWNVYGSLSEHGGATPAAVRLSASHIWKHVT